MKIPSRIEELLKQDQALHGSVLSTIDIFGKWLSDNKTTFFPEFTDHGTKHIESVLRGIEGLISESSWEFLTSADAAVCVLSTLLHDVVMHLSDDSFSQLINIDNDWQPESRHFNIAKFPSAWPQKWEHFLSEAAHFDDKRLNDIFGKPVIIRRPPADTLEWTDQDRLLIGDFLRKHHATLAHEIALVGVPGPTSKRLHLAEIDEWMRDLIGLIARSHNLPLRLSADEMPPNGRRVWRGVHAPFLMALLRIADYLEIQAPRAPETVLRVRSLRSPISRQEWKNHKAIFDICEHENDPECIWVDTEPQDLKTFLRLRNLFTGIQSELDSTWATIGEIYASDKKLSSLGIRIRRIKSTIDDLSAFEKKVDYIPKHARFKTADAELLKLLIGPLYGNNPSFGIRELMQNAVDAVRERINYEQTLNISSDLTDSQIESDVIISLEENQDKTGWLTVTDRGIGMTSDIILNYFLTAGATYRSSAEWHILHDSANGEPCFPRSGRFGVGLLAAFLLGPTIEVNTRHASQPDYKGISFTCRLDAPEIELTWKNLPIGTTIRIGVTNHAMNYLLDVFSDDLCGTWDWYTSKNPSVLRKIFLRHQKSTIKEKEIPLEKWLNIDQEYTLPSSNESLPKEWRRLAQKGFDDIQWTWGGPRLVCNGFPLGTPHSHSIESNSYIEPIGDDDWDNSNISIKIPTLNIFDSLNNLPINLARTGLKISNIIPLLPALGESVCRDVLAFLLVRTPENYQDCIEFMIDSTSSVVSPKYINRNIGFDHPGVNKQSYTKRWHWLTMTKDGITISETSLLKLLNLSSIVLFPDVYPIRDFPSKNMISFSSSSEGIILLDGGSESLRHESLRIKWVRTLIKAILFGPPKTKPVNFSDEDTAWLYFAPWLSFHAESCSLLVSKSFWDKNLESSFTDTAHKPFGKYWELIYRGEDPISWIDINHLSRIKPDEPHAAIGMWKISHDCSSPELGYLGKIWLDIFKQPLIPFCKDKRQLQLKSAYDELAPEIARWEEHAGTYWLARIRDQAISQESSNSV